MITLNAWNNCSIKVLTKKTNLFETVAGSKGYYMFDINLQINNMSLPIQI